MLQTILSALWNLLITNWKTTATGIAIGLIWLAGQFGVEIPAQTKQDLTALLISLGLLFSKDGNKL